MEPMRGGIIERTEGLQYTSRWKRREETMQTTEGRNRGAVTARVIFGLLCVGMFAGGCRTVADRRDDGRKPQPVDDITAESKAQRLNMHINSQSAGNDARNAAIEVQSAVQSALTEGGYRIDPSHPDVRVSLVTEIESFDASGNFYRFDGRIRAAVERVADKRLLGENTFEKRGDRTLGQAAAIRAVSTPLARQTADWLVNVAAPARSGLAAEDITVVNRRFSSRRRRNEFIEYFVERVKVEPGVVSCRLIDQDDRQRELVFRIVYFPDQFDDGLLTRIVNMQELDIKTR